ncbi:MAG TPA: DUF4880 domain-containing protein, partial [Caulobacteraceae bacterium]|nr:DUF4880 domain-containing protein [Caulobacteraceae bacterium]
MSDRDNNLDLDALASEARAWVGRMASGEATSADTAALMLWRSLSSEHARALGEAVRLRRRVVAAGQELRSQPNARWLVSRPSRQSGGAIGRRAFIGGAVAASVAALAVRPPMGLWPSLPELLEELQADYRTRTGERKTVVIARGLAVELN